MSELNSDERFVRDIASGLSESAWDLRMIADRLDSEHTIEPVMAARGVRFVADALDGLRSRLGALPIPSAAATSSVARHVHTCVHGAIGPERGLGYAVKASDGSGVVICRDCAERTIREWHLPEQAFANAAQTRSDAREPAFPLSDEERGEATP